MAEFIAALQQAEVEQVIDVRALPLSRRPGFSKSPLQAALAEAGIEYVHLKALGTPADEYPEAAPGGTAALSEPRTHLCEISLEFPKAMVAAEQMRELAAEKPSALLCYEREPAQCRRSLLAPAAAAPAAAITAHLSPKRRSEHLSCLEFSNQQRLDVWDRAAGHFLRNSTDDPLGRFVVELLADDAERLGRGDDRQRLEVIIEDALC